MFHVPGRDSPFTASNCNTDTLKEDRVDVSLDNSERTECWNECTEADPIGLHIPESDNHQERVTLPAVDTGSRRISDGQRSREFIKELRRDTQGEAVDLDDHINRSERRASTLGPISMGGT